MSNFRNKGIHKDNSQSKQVGVSDVLPLCEVLPLMKV